MARILALETSAERCSVALLNGEQLSFRDEVAPRQHAQRLLPLINEVLAEQTLNLNELDALAFGCGPGSFTGLRIAAGFVQGLAYGADLPVVPVSNLKALALAAVLETAESDKLSDKYLACIDARMDELYWGAFSLSRDQNGLLLEPSSAEHVTPPENLELPLEAGSWVAAGSGLAFKERFPESVLQAISCCSPEIQVNAAHIAKLAVQDWLAGKAVKAELAQPTYIRDEVAWKKLPGRE